MTLQEAVALAIHETVCARIPCTPGTDWVAAAGAALADLDRQMATDDLGYER